MCSAADQYDSVSNSANLQIAPGVWAPAQALRIGFSRSGGPGGQNVNKINSKAELWLKIDSIIGLNSGALARLRALAGARLTQAGEIHLRAQTERSQESNRQEVLDRLRELIIQARIEPKHRRKTKPSRAAKQRRLEGKKRRGQIKRSRRGTLED